ncbi:hypothetical protein PAAG_11400 [Paracoccidioides lutzii Pb01]|uniref:Uncharacterized protein n=1 Tax=Paracoccidioides lutzii (strain ATCC MYA-826 / Pb01) TaxID=502779 RepID=A0A0A2V6T5_PARBA|nr:hypothetical protein PAAG_11400 [Paracoccidioides lutzii Pb01]KGQ01825.1 hypothetical protein PAAG_11400 [Paracoccidioides lutzii Pb01]
MNVLEPQGDAAGFTSTSRSHTSRNFNGGHVGISNIQTYRITEELGMAWQVLGYTDNAILPIATLQWKQTLLPTRGHDENVPRRGTGTNRDNRPMPPGTMAEATALKGIHLDSDRARAIERAILIDRYINIYIHLYASLRFQLQGRLGQSVTKPTNQPINQSINQRNSRHRLESVVLPQK